MAANYDSILNRAWSEVQKNKVLPNGSWVLALRNASVQAPKTEDGDPALLFVYEPVEPNDDVDEAELASLGGDYDVSNNRIYQKFWLGNDTDWDNVRRHLVKHGLSEDDVNSMNLGDSLKRARGRKVAAKLQRKTFVSGGVQKVDNEAIGFETLH